VSMSVSIFNLSEYIYIVIYPYINCYTLSLLIKLNAAYYSGLCAHSPVMRVSGMEADNSADSKAKSMF